MYVDKNLALRKSADNLVLLVDLMGKESRMPCFSSGVAYATTQLRQRFQLQLSEAEAETFVDESLIQKSLGSYFTRMVILPVCLCCSVATALSNADEKSCK